MAIPKKRIFLLPLLQLTLLSSGCEESRRTETKRTVTTNDSTVTISKKGAEQDLRELREWINAKTIKADSNFEKNLPKMKEDFKKRSAKIETRLDSLSEESKREYAILKAKYNAWENIKNARTSQPLSDVKLIAWRKELLDDRQELTTITGHNAKETYLLFMGIVRAKNQNWTPEDWDYVDLIYSELNNRKRAVDNQISAADGLKIKTLQAEYLALEAKSDAADAYKYMKKK